MRLPFFQSFCLGSIALLLTACGGGGGGNGGGSGETVLTGQFIDSAVSGIRYTTATRSGVTDGNGQFEYLDGETVDFYIGEQLLGDAPGAATITLFDLVDGVEPLVGNALQTTLAKLNERRYRYQSGKRRPNFSTVINLAVLLQTLDKDGDPANGIEIQPEVAALFAANSVKFNRHWEDFKLDRGFRKVLGDAKSHALLDNARQVRKSWRAMAHLYASLAIDSKLRAISISTSYDHGRSTPNSIYKFTYDDEGKLIRQDYDSDGHGTENEANIYTYDANGNETLYEYDYNADGISDSFRMSVYDADGNLVRVEWNGGHDNTPGEIRIYSYDAYGNETRFEEYGYFGLRSFSTKSYDPDGRQTHAFYPQNGQGTNVNLTWSYSDNGYELRREYTQYGYPHVDILLFDNDDNLLREETDYESDGVLDFVQVYTHDAQGNEIRFEIDNDGNGTTDYIRTTTYDADENVIREEWDSDNDGKPDSIETHNYDANGNLTRIEYDGNGDGIPHGMSSTTYEYDTDGNLIRSEHDGNGDGMTDYVRISTYDANGILIETTHDYDLDGTPDSVQTWDYTADTDDWWSALHWPEYEPFWLAPDPLVLYT